MQVTCLRCQTRFDAKLATLARPPLCPRCEKKGVSITERVALDDRPADQTLKERELRECN